MADARVPQGQPRRHSVAEVVASTCLGFEISYWLNYYLMPAFGHPITHEENFWITGIFTIVSLIRGYFLRRLFNRLHTFLTKDSS